LVAANTPATDERASIVIYKHHKFDCVLTLHVSCLSYTRTQPQANGGLSEYERLRQERIARNNARLAELGFDDKPKKVKKKVVPQRKSLDEFAVRRQNPDRARRATTFNEDELLMDIGLKVDKRDKPPSRGLEPPPINWGKTPTGKLKKCGKCDGCMRENNCETCVACVSYPGKVKCIFKKCQGWTDDANEDGKESDEEEEEEEEDHHDTECNVCQDGGDLICCDSCHRSYHSDCHKPKIWDVPKKGDQWICMVCRKEQKALQFYKPKYGCPLIADLGGGKEVKCNVQFPKLECIVCEEVEGKRYYVILGILSSCHLIVLRLTKICLLFWNFSNWRV
jgi:hypothetical protein